MEASEIADVIIERFAEKGKAEGKRKCFGYVDSYSNGIIVSRENGKDTKISKLHLIATIEAVRIDPSIYDSGPAGLRKYINKRIYSPLWALLRLVSIDELVSEGKETQDPGLPEAECSCSFLNKLKTLFIISK